MASAPIRQPRGPSTNSFTSGPPQADTDSLRRAKSISNTITPSQRHGPSASISSTPSASSAFHGHGTGLTRSKFTAGRFRSGSLSSGAGGVGDGSSGLVRKGSGREAVRTEDPVIEAEESSPATETGNWGGWSGKGLDRQSSLPSRRGSSILSDLLVHLLIG
jgi:hypothetical protein